MQDVQNKEDNSPALKLPLSLGPETTLTVSLCSPARCGALSSPELRRVRRWKYNNKQPLTGAYTKLILLVGEN